MIIIAGIIMIVAGAAAIIYGVSLNNSVEAQLEAFFGSGTTDPGTTWIIIGAVVAVAGVILLIYGLTKENSSTKPEDIPSRVNSKITCSNCGATLDATAGFCSHCGTPVKEERKPKADPGRTISCPKCATTLAADAAFCTYCGTSLKDSIAPKSVPTRVDIPKPTVKAKSDRPAVCPHCGARQSSENSNCKYCGTPMR